MVRVFVYGTLKPGEANYDRYCAGIVVEWQEAIVQGRLFDLPLGYPAMTEGEEWVHGCLLAFTDSTLLSELDELEGYDLDRPIEQNEYQRQQIEVFDAQQRSLGWAWAYVMLPEQVEAFKGVLLPNGKWMGKPCYPSPP